MANLFENNPIEKLEEQIELQQRQLELQEDVILAYQQEPTPFGAPGTGDILMLSLIIGGLMFWIYTMSKDSNK